jgi:hypothetical protein
LTPTPSRTSYSLRLSHLPVSFPSSCVLLCLRLAVCRPLLLWAAEWLPAIALDSESEESPGGTHTHITRRHEQDRTTRRTCLPHAVAWGARARGGSPSRTRGRGNAIASWAAMARVDEAGNAAAREGRVGAEGGRSVGLSCLGWRAACGRGVGCGSGRAIATGTRVGTEPTGRQGPHAPLKPLSACCARCPPPAFPPVPPGRARRPCPRDRSDLTPPFPASGSVAAPPLPAFQPALPGASSVFA